MLNEENYGHNSSGHKEFDPIKYEKDRWIFPEKYAYYFEDYFEIKDADEDDINQCYILDPNKSKRITRDDLFMYQYAKYNLEHYIDIVKIETYISAPLNNNNLQNSVEIFWNEHFNNPDDKYFFRLNSISPKDYSDHETSGCCVSSSEDIMKLLKLSNRTRYYLENFNEKIPIRLVLRKWIDPFPAEFRCFIHGNKLRAISQNFNGKIKKNEQQTIYEEIVKFYKTICHKIPYDDAVMDVIKMDDKWVVLEFNPFGCETSTGSGLFNWIEDYQDLYFSKTPIIRFM